LPEVVIRFSYYSWKKIGVPLGRNVQRSGMALHC